MTIKTRDDFLGDDMAGLLLLVGVTVIAVMTLVTLSFFMTSPGCARFRRRLAAVCRIAANDGASLRGRKVG